MSCYHVSAQNLSKAANTTIDASIMTKRRRVGTAASMAPGFEDANASEESMAIEACWAKSKVSRNWTT